MLNKSKTRLNRNLILIQVINTLSLITILKHFWQSKFNKVKLVVKDSADVEKFSMIVTILAKG